MNAPTPVKTNPGQQASGFIASIAGQLNRYLVKVGPLEEERAELKKRLAEVESLIAKFSPIKHQLDRLVHRFWRFAQRRRQNFLITGSKTIRTGAGAFGWRQNSVDTLVYEPGTEEAVAKELLNLGRLDLLELRLKKDAIKAAYNSGQLQGVKTFTVERHERFFVVPNGLNRVSLCEDGSVEISD
jgi:hypothetical protein